MNSIVCFKIVPDSAANVKTGADGKTIDEAGVKYVLNPYDEYALEQAVRLKEAHEGEVLVITLAPEKAETNKLVRQALATGADRAIRINDEAEFRDALDVARALADAIKASGFEYRAIFFGRRAIDTDDNAVGPMLAQLLDIPCVTTISTFEYDAAAGTVNVARGIEGGEERIEGVPLPAVFTCDKGLNQPRYPSLKGITAAKKRPLDTQESPEAAPQLELLRLEPPLARAPGRVVGEGAKAVPELVRLLREEARTI